MLLKDAKSKEQVSEALAAKDQELRDDIWAMLEEAESDFFDSDAEYGEDPFEFDTAEEFFSDFIEHSDKFADEIIAQSASTGYDLKYIDKKYVETNCRLLASDSDSDRRGLRFGNFIVSEYGRADFSVDVSTERYVRFSDRFGPPELWENAHLIPENEARVFWGNMADRMGLGFREHGGWQDGVSTFGENHGYLSGETYYITAEEDVFKEFCRDTLSDYLDDEAKANPDAVIARLFTMLPADFPVEALKSLLEEGKLDRKDVLDYAVTAMVDEDEDERNRAIKALEARIAVISDPEASFDEFVSEVMEKLSEQQQQLFTKLIESGAIDKKEMLQKAESVWSETASYERNRVLDEVVEEIEDYLATMEEDPNAKPRDILLTIDRADLKSMGIEGGVFWEEAPWKLTKLRASDLPYEGRTMRHCVGNKGMGYAKAVQRGEIEIWSLRDRNSKPRFTLEVESAFHRQPPSGEDEKAATVAKGKRAEAIKQLKGKGNRTPGYIERSARDVTFQDEVTLWKWILKKLHVSPEHVRDFNACRIPTSTQQVAGSTTLSFDQPYQPSRLAVTASLDSLADQMHEQRLPTPVLLAVEEACAILHSDDTE